MAFGGGGSADYRANLILDTSQPERQIQAFGGKMATALRAINRNFNANIGQSLRETTRYTNTIKARAEASTAKAADAIAKGDKPLARSHLANARSLRNANRVIQEQVTKLRDLQLQGKATTADLRQLATVLKAVSQYRGISGDLSDRASSLSKTIRGRAKENPKTISTVQPLKNMHIQNAELEDAAAARHRIAQRIIADQARANQMMKRQEQERIKAEQAHVKELDDVARRQEQAVKALMRGSRGLRGFTMSEKRSGLTGKLFGDKTWTVGDATERARSRLGSIGRGGGGGGRRSGGGHGGHEEDGKERGQLMPLRSKGAAQALLGLSSAAQGAMIGIAALDANLVGLGFSLVFLGYGVVSVALLFAALTIAVGATIRVFKLITTAALAAGKAFETSGQQLANWFRSADLAMQFKAENIQIAKTFGVAIDEVDKLRFSLEQVGLKGPAYVKAALNASGAGLGAPSEIASRFADIAKAPSDQRGDLAARLARDMNVPIKQYASTLELAEAINERFAGSAEAMAQTTEGAIQRMRNTWQEFVIGLGVLLNEYVKPIVDVVQSLFQGLVDGFKAAYKTDAATGQLKRTVDELQAAIRKLMPYLYAIGLVLGRVIYRTAIWAAQGLKILADVMRSSLKWAKEHKDEFRAAGTSFKENFLDVLVGAPAILASVGGFLSGFGATLIKAFKPKIILEGAEIVGGEAVEKGLWAKVFGGITSAPKALLAGIFKGLKQGLLFALIEATALTAVDLLPVSESIKESLSGSIRTTLTGAAIGSMFGPVGTLVGAALGLAIGAGLEAIKPGLSNDVMNWVDEVVLSGLRKLGSFVTQTVVPGFQAAGAAVGDWAKNDAEPALRSFQGWLDEKVIPKTKEWADATADYLGPRLKDMGNWIRNDGMSALGSFAGRVAETVTPAMQRLGGYLGEKFGPLLGDVGTFITEHLVPAMGNLASWANEHVTPAISKLVDIFKFVFEIVVTVSKFLAETFGPVLMAFANLGVSLVVGTLRALLDILGFVLDHFGTFMDVIGKVFDKLVPFNKEAGDLATLLADKLVPPLKDFGSYIKDTLLPVIGDLIELSLKPLEEILNTLADIVDDPFAAMSSAISTAVGYVTWLWEWLGAVKSIATEISWPEPPGWAKSLIEIGLGSIPGGGLISVGLGSITGHAKGGIVGGPSGAGDVIPIMASPGELILNLAQQRAVAGRLVNGGGGGGVVINVMISDTVVTNSSAMEELAGRVATQITNRIGTGKSLTFHRI